MAASAPSRVTGIVLAAGAGRRFGGPKVLASDASGTPWVQRAVDALQGGGCDGVIVVLGAAAAQAELLVPPSASVVVAAEWEAGLSRSLAAGMDAAGDADAVILVPVDTPALPAAAVTRIRTAAGEDARHALVRSTYGGHPGHPVLVGSAHWGHLRAQLSGDAGAGAFLTRAGATAVECGDLWTGADHDRRP
ncbi:NTP transferase domain-containing protein [Microbacterium lushaniae]|nr:NTP transferase domain-containing protein [Microbacterium lushaniae]KAA9154470.1 NTP transferase domain-containing protein [Microbacterium lushaniae]